jgi:hypothetical protein
VGKNPKNKANKTVSNNSGRKHSIPKKDLFDNLEVFFEKHLNKVFWLSMLLTLLISVLLFDKHFSLSGDDTNYIIRARDFIHNFKYPGFQGPLYPILISPLVLLFGINLVVLKILSLVFMLGFVYFTFKSFTGRISPLILSIVLLLISINPFLMYYSSQTYSEALYLFIQALTIYIFFRYVIDEKDRVPDYVNYSGYLLLSFCILLLCLTRNIGYSFIPALLVYFILKKEWRKLLLTFVSIVFVFGLFQIIKYWIWHDPGLQFSSQGAGLLNKNFYNPAEGRETLKGFLDRLFVNSDLYLSRHFPIILGLRPENFDIATFSSITILIYVLLILGIILIVRKNKYLFFTGIYTCLVCFISFFALQIIWDQNRLAIPYTPLLILFLLSSLYFVFNLGAFVKIRILLIFISLCLFITTLGSTILHVKKVQKIHGEYYGLTLDWENYMKISKWAVTNLPENSVIACRKPSISTIYSGGGHFFGIYQIPTFSGDSILTSWEKNNDNYFLLAYDNIKDTIHFPVNLYKTFSGNVSALVVKDTSLYYLFKTKENFKMKLFSQLDSIKIPYYINSDYWTKYFRDQKKSHQVYIPDSLMNYLIRNRVEYMICSSLRTYADQKTDYTSDAIVNYIFYLECRYPDLFVKIMQMGSDKDEPATLYRVNYEFYKIMLAPVSEKNR